MSDTLLQKNWPWLIAALGILLALLWSSIEWTTPIEDDRPLGGIEEIESLSEREDLNILFILIDTLRADRLGMYGYERDTSPTLDRLASEGIRFNRHLSQSSWTKSSMASMWTGFYPTRTGVTRYDHIVPEEAVMPAERLKQAGYATVGLYRNGWVAPTFGFEQGFDVYTRPPRRMMNPKVRAENPTISTAGTDEDTVAAAIEFLRVNGGGEKWFLYLHLMDIHEYLYDEENAVFGGTYPDMYDNSILWTDGSLEILFEHLIDFGLADNTMIVFGSDHGEAFRERGLEGHARAVYRETTEVPFFISMPFKMEEGVVVEARTQNVDIWPTIYELIGIDGPENGNGRSRVPEILAAARGEEGSVTPEPAQAISFLDDTWGRRGTEANERIAVVEGPLRYLRTPVRNTGEVRDELFDASTDPRELKEISEEVEPAELSRLREVAEGELAAEPAWGSAPTRELDELELNQLRALGYAIP